MPTPHIGAEKGDFAKVVLMPGDPLRAKFVADNFLHDVKEVTHVRGILGYTGYTKNGKRISVMASGMGMPSIGIYSWDGSQNLNGNDRYHSFVRLTPNADLKKIQDEIKVMVQEIYPWEELRAAGYTDLGFGFYPVSEKRMNNTTVRTTCIILLIVAGDALHGCDELHPCGYQFAGGKGSTCGASQGDGRAQAGVLSEDAGRSLWASVVGLAHYVPAAMGWAGLDTRPDGN